MNPNTTNRVLTITRWSETFENADTRKRERLKFFHSPSGCESAGYLELMTCHQSAGIMAFGIFQALCQLAATMPSTRRGKFVKTNGSAMSLPQIALLIRVEVCHLNEAIEILASKEIGWLSWHETPNKSATNLPPASSKECRQSATNLPENSGFVQGEGQGKGKGQGKDHHHQEAKIDDDDGEWWSEKHPTDIANRMGDLQKMINDLHPSWKKRPHFSAKELHALHENAKAWSTVEPSDWALLKAYMFASIPDDWRKDPRDLFQPDNRLGLINMGPSSVLSGADKWLKLCKRNNVPTGLESEKA